MAKMSSRQAIGKLSSGSMKSSRGRNIAAIIAIALTALLFTGVLTVGMSMVDFMQEQTMRQVGTSAHAGFKTLTQEQYDKVAADPEVRDISYNILLGTAENPELVKHYTEIRWSEEKSAKWDFHYPEEGKLPEKYNELACGTGVLEMLGVPQKLGSTVTLEYTANGVYHKDDFVLCGWWKSDKAMRADTALVSKPYVEKNAPTPSILYAEQTDYRYNAGYLNPDIWFDTSWDIESQVMALKERCGFDYEANEGVNWAYGTSYIDSQGIAFIIGILLLIVISGYLIIYNIFAISVARDIRFYGLLKTIGTTKRQIRKIVMKQAVQLSAIGIPIGLVLGWLTGKFMIPIIFAASSYAYLDDFSTSVNPVIFVAGALLALITVLISCIKPARTAAKVSPVEAVRWTDSKQGKKTKSRKSMKINTFSMARANLRRTPGKTWIVIIGLSLSMILLNCVYTIYSGFDEETYIKDYVAADFTVGDSSVLEVGGAVREIEGVTPQMMDDIRMQPGITDADSGAVYYNDVYYDLEGKAYDRALALAEILKENENPMYIEPSLKILNDEHQVICSKYGLSDFAASKLEMFEGDFDLEKFKSGDYIIISPYMDYQATSEGMETSYFDIGEKVTIKWEDGTEKSYEVMAIGEVPYALGPKYSTYFSSQLILPESEYLAHRDTEGALNFSADVEDSYEQGFEEWLSGYCDNSYSLTFESKNTYLKEFEAARTMIMGVGGAIAGVIGLISILNFINSMVTSVFSRRREIAVMQSMGMTAKQLNHMLIWEGLIYNLGAALLTLTVGSVLSYFAMKGVASFMLFFVYHFTILPLLICLPILIIAAILVPGAAYRSLCKESIIERLREAE